MRIQNKTEYLTTDLAAIIRRVAHAEFDQKHLRRVRVVAQYRRSNGRTLGRGIIGSGSYPSGWIQLLLDRDPAKLDKVTLAHTIAHEFAHNKGLRHRDLHNTRYGYTEGWRELYAWAADMPLRLKAPKPKLAPSTKAQKQLAYAHTMLAKSQRKAKLAATLVKRWQRRVRYYTRRAAALLPAEMPRQDIFARTEFGQCILGVRE
jgi:hypothetical protein